MSVYYKHDGITLYLGDCREHLEWLDADVLVTDPPYGVAWVARAMDFSNRPKISGAVANDETPELRDAALTLWGDRAAVVFGTWRVPRPAATKHRLIWHKKRSYPAYNTAPFYPVEEEIYILGAGFVGGPTPNVLSTTELRGTKHGLVHQSGHPTPKPVPLMQSLITQCPPGTIADPFAGSGSTLVAARLEGREAIGVELVEKYCEIVARRLDQGVLEFPA